MEKLKVYFDEARRAPNVANFISFVISPDAGEPILVGDFYNDILSNDPSKVQNSIDKIENKNIPLHIAAQGLKEFIERMEFNQQSPYELTAFDSVRHEDPADSHIHFSKFFDTTLPFGQSYNYLVLTKKGLTRVGNKSQQPQYKTSRSYQKESVEACFIATSRLIANSIERPEDSIPDTFLQECSFGPLFSNFFDLFGTDSINVYWKSELGINLLYQHGSIRDQQAIDQIRQALGITE